MPVHYISDQKDFFEIIYPCADISKFGRNTDLNRDSQSNGHEDSRLILFLF